MDEETQRVDAVIKTQFPSLSRRQIEEALESGLVVDATGTRIKKGDRLPPANVQLRRLSDQLAFLAQGNRDLRLKILDQGPDVVVVEKPAGMPCRPETLLDAKSITAWALSRFPNLRKEFPDPQPTVTPYTIESGIAGIVLVAKDRAGFQTWHDRYEKKELTFSYLAWCWGEPKPHRFFISTPLGKLPGDDDQWVVATPEMKFNPPAKDAVTVVRVAERFKRPEEKGFFLAEITVSSNVAHQARVHMAHQGYPVMGDKLYDPQFEKRPTLIAELQLLMYEMEFSGHKAKLPGDPFRAKFSA